MENDPHGDAQLAASWAVDAFSKGRILLGFEAAKIALKAQRFAAERGIEVIQAGVPTPIHDDISTTTGWLTSPAVEVEREREVYPQEYARPITPPPTSRCTAVVVDSGVPRECHEAIVWDKADEAWYHVDQTKGTHPAEPRVREQQQQG